jgi:threonyl-tRNA synthetase
MRLVFVHVDAVTLSRGERALDDPDGRAVAASEGEALASASMGSALVAFATVETGDGTAADAVRAAAARAVRERANDLRVDDVVLLPTALSSDRAAAPTAAAAVWDGLPAAVGSDGLASTAAGFGWDYGIDVTTKAHPFATTARTVRPGDATVDAGSDGGESSRRVVLPDGTSLAPASAVDDADGRDLDPAVGRALRAVVPTLADPPRVTSAPSGAPPPDRGDRARELGVADCDPLAVEARLRPVGGFLRDALSGAVAALARARDPTPTVVRGPRALDLGADGVRAYAATLGDRGHGVAVDDAQVLPDALGAATALATLADADVTDSAGSMALFDRHAPAPAPSTERTQGLTGGGAAPTVHGAYRRPEAARDAVVAYAEAAVTLAVDCGRSVLPVVTVSPAFDDANADWVDGLAARLDSPTLVVVDAAAPAAWPLQFEAVAATPEGDALATGLVRLDDDGLRHFATDADAVPSVVHAAPAGHLDATVAAICDASATPNAGDAATVLPDWLAPTQVRLVPVAAEHVPRADAVADALETAGVRVDVDDRERTVGARLAAAERERVPRYVVLGDDDHPDGPLPVTDVATGREREQTVDALASDVRGAAATLLPTDDAPPRPFPRHRSNRLAFATDDSQ